MQCKLEDLVVQKHINLLQNEPFKLQFSQYVSEPTYTYELQGVTESKNGQDDTIFLKQPMSDISGVPILESQQLDIALASFYSGKYQKNQIGLVLKQNTEGSYDVMIGFQIITIEQQGQNKSVKSQVYTNPSKIDVVSSTINLQTSYGSMYNQNEGLIIHTNEDCSIYQIIFNPSTLLPLFQVIKGPPFTKHTSVEIIQDNTNLVYVILYYQQQINLYLLNPQTKQLLCLDTYQPESEKVSFNSNSLSPINGYFFAYAISNSYLYIFSIDFAKEKLTWQMLPLTNTGSFLGAQQIDSYIIFIQSDGIMEFVQSNNQNINNSLNNSSNQLELIRTISFPQVPKLNFYLFQPIFLSRNIFVQINYVYVLIYDLNANRMISTQSLVSDLNNIVGQLDYIQNILIAYMYKDKKLVEIKYAEVQSPYLGIQVGEEKSFSVIMSGQYQKVELKVNISIALGQQQSAYQIVFEQSQILLSNVISFPFQSLSYFAPIGKYITASDLCLQIQQSDKQSQLLNPLIIKTLPFSPKINIPQQNILKSYQTDYLFSSIIQYQDFTISAIYMKTPSKLNSGNGKENKTQNTEEDQIIEYKCSQKFDSSIDTIDNYGTFTLTADKQSKTKHIYLPVINQEIEQLFFYSIEVDCDPSQTFKFASDTLSSLLFVSCGSILTQYKYQFNLNNSNIPTFTKSNQKISFKNNNSYVISGQILNMNTIQIDVSKYNKQICIQGLLLFWNTKNILAYDYHYNGIFPTSINIPSSILDSQQWDIILFKDSFLIYGLSQQSTVFIYQYSYNQFSDSNPLFLRSLQIDETHQISSQLVLIPKRGIQDECVYVLSNQISTYFVYRMNPTYYSQNQLFTSVVFDSQNPKNNYFNSKTDSQKDISNSDDKDLSILLADANTICQLNKEQISCLSILPEPFIEYKLGIPEAEFMAQLTFQENFYLQNENDNKQNYSLIVQRNASVFEGVVNQQAKSIQDIRTQLQDENTQSQYYDIKFDDKGVFNSNLLGWEIASQTIKQMEIKNRISLKESYPTLTYFNILYNLQVILNKDKDVQLTNDLTIKGPFVDCIVMDDKGSLKWIDKTVINFQLFILCPSIIYSYQIQLSNYLDPMFNKQSNLSLTNQSTERNNFINFKNNEQISGTIISQKKNDLGQSVRFYPNSYERIMTLNKNVVILFSEGSMSQVQLMEQNDGSISLVYNDQFCSINNIYSLSLQLNIYTNGSIIVGQQKQNNEAEQDASTIQMVYLQDLLFNHMITVDSNDVIQSVQQYSDDSFAIAFKNSFVYDIQFGLSQEGQLVILKVSIYHYLDAFSKIKYFYKSSRYTLIIGNTNYSNYMVSLYDNQQQMASNQYLIISTYTTPFYYMIRSISTLIDNTIQNFQISVLNLTIILDISDYIGITIKQPDLAQATVYLMPKDSKNPQNQIGLLVKSSSQDSSHSFYLTFYYVCFIFLYLSS